MKSDIVGGSGNDEFYTPKYAVMPILPHIPADSTVWCPFDTDESLFVRLFRARGNEVIATHICDGYDYFQTDTPAGVDYIVSNPPYSLKGEVLSDLFGRGVPFAMLVAIVGLFESQKRFEMFRDNDFEILYLNRRVSYFRNYGDQKPDLNPPFSSAYVCGGLLPERIMFAEIDKRDTQIGEAA